jgi:HD-like signal output (HDOD) protein
MTSPTASLPPKLALPLRDLNAWTSHFRSAEIPVLAHTALAIEALRANEDNADANGIGETIANDPLMTLKVLAHASTHRSSRVVTDCETVIAALVMMGISPFFAAFGPQPTVEDRLAEEPEALEGLINTLRRAHRGANFALGFAVHRMDHDAAVIHAAALLHDFAEMLLWCHAPALALKIRSAQRADPALRSSVAQRAVLNVELADLQQSLMKSWHLPELLIRISDDRHADNANVRSVTLALRLARHTAQGWDNPAVPDDVNEIATLLNLSQAATLQLVREI